MISLRILSWSEDNEKFAESQTGFRPGRGCTDNIFSLACIVNIHLIKHRKLYASFVDFRSAFSEVDHTLLWKKMMEFGLPFRITSLMQRLYNQAEVRIRSGTKYTPPCKVNKGLLQGDCISPLLFLIFINDIEQFFKDKGAIGVPISHEQDILTLLYADDLIIFGSSKTDLQQKLNILQDYCQQNRMMVNVEKSKVVIFRRGGRLAATDNFTYNGQNMEISNQFNYLGVMFSSHGVFHKAAEQALCKGRVAVANVRRTMTNSKMVSFDSRLKLFNAVVKATLLYGCETWGSRYEDEIEKCQSYFFKSIYCLQRNTPCYVLRLEMGVVRFHSTMFPITGWVLLGSCFLVVSLQQLQHHQCRISEYACENGRCISLDRFCNEYDDCGDKSDEPRYCSREFVS
ncbi:hypothetical protein M8J77_007453 [Diaphorina citri]|nr:hypothetical protein M8J77_007453 [Diaphorina citri]